jgi:crossover junction endodeoxyribonuclease RuvC
MARKQILAIDPGKKGILNLYDGGTFYIVKMPDLNSVLGQRELLIILKDIKTIAGYEFDRGESLISYVEEAVFIPGTFTGIKYYWNYGMIIMALTASQIRYETVKPQTWKADVLKGTTKDKEAAIEYVARKYPQVDMTPGKMRKPHDGIADSVCIAEYGYKKTHSVTRRTRRRA